MPACCAGINGVAVGAPIKPAGLVFEASQAAEAAANASSVRTQGMASAAPPDSEAAADGTDLNSARRRSSDTGLPGALRARG